MDLTGMSRNTKKMVVADSAAEYTECKNELNRSNTKMKCHITNFSMFLTNAFFK